MTKTAAPERATDQPSEAASSTPYETLALFIDGEFIAGDRKTQDVRNPATGEVIGKLPHATREDLDRLVESGLALWPSV